MRTGPRDSAPPPVAEQEEKKEHNYYMYRCIYVHENHLGALGVCICFAFKEGILQNG